ncbi:MAG: hypothetical protein CMA63_05450 [Euryarchaeota archaeon]|nr:hypothetical protein [Euryarchaeota archaeon]|tara:strand:+ start:5092 stop:5586 length:495 start_codon:yes stop_codon:yes gene_type:complete
MNTKKSVILTLIVFSASLSGCLSDDVKELQEFPSFSLSDEQGNVHENSNYSNLPYVAYFSASWCSHCKPVLQALDETIPEGQLLVFNKESREQYSDMNEWKDRMESELERNLSHPFIHAPPLSQSLNVTGIPTMFYVNSDGLIEHSMSGTTDKPTIEAYWNGLS